MSGGRKLAFIVTEDWFFASHFLPMIRAARDAGLEPVVIARVRKHGAVSYTHLTLPTSDLV